VSTIELDRGGVTYTYETLEAIHGQRPGDELFLLIGADSLRDLPTWRRPERICELAIPLVVHRPDSPAIQFDALSSFAPPERIAQFRQYNIAMPLVDFSSTEIRRRVAAGQSIRYRTPAAVAKYIETHELYRQP
jgi:nicotinate-nucleotide adenylyltransferase